MSLPTAEKSPVVPYGMSSLALAHVGDAVYELLVRTRLTAAQRTAKTLHAATVKLVCAPAQAQAVQAILPMLTEQETDVYKRARNTRPSHVPHGATPGQYAQATALEALFGYLYLSGELARIEELFNICWTALQQPDLPTNQG